MPYEPIENFRTNIEYDRSSFPVRENTGLNGTWSNPLKLGNYSVWLNAVDGKLYKKEGTPVNDNDGVIVDIEN